MMTASGFVNLAVQSVTAPGDVARLLVSLRLNREALWTAFALVVVGNALVFSLGQLASPPAPELAPLLASPAAFAALLAGSMIAMILALTWTGQAMGHAARIDDVAILVIWLQALRVLVQVVLLLILPLSASLAALVVVAASVVGIYILIHFIAAAFDTEGLARAALILILGTFGMALGLTLVFSLLGLTPQGM